MRPSDPSAQVTSRRVSLIKKHFPDYLLRLLFSARGAYQDLKHFIPVFAGLQAAGCEVPGTVDSLARFATAGLTS